MKHCSIIILLVFVWSHLVQVVVAQNNGQSGTMARMKYDVSVLASDSLQGREAGTPGEQKAASYIANEMIGAGLLPKAEKPGSYLSSFRMSYPVAFKDVQLKINNIDFAYPEEIGATDLSAAGTVEAQLINTGNRNYGFNDKSTSNFTNELKGKIVVIDIATRDFATNNNSISIEYLNYIKQLVACGAVGIIFHNSSNKPSEDKLFGSPFTEPLSVPVIYVSRLAYNKIRKLKHATCKLTVELDRTITNPTNVVGFIDNKSEKTVVIGAHYDHIGVTYGKNSREQKQQINNGADDNASGVAVMLELARWAVNNESLKYNYIFVAFSAEEKGLFGSKAFCSREWVNADNIAYMLNLDMVGRLGCQGDTIQVLGISSSPVWENLIQNLNHPDFAIQEINGAPPFSDHAPFLKKKIPVIYFTSGTHPDYHTPNDDIEYINFEGMSELVSYIRQFIRMAESFPEIQYHKINTIEHTKAYFQTFN